MKSDTDFSPTKRYGHTSVFYEPVTSDQLGPLLVQKPRINAATNIYDCKNGGEIEQLDINHLVVSYCKCKNLYTGNGWNYFTGPQC